jgi:hypothetical protein
MNKYEEIDIASTRERSRVAVNHQTALKNKVEKIKPWGDTVAFIRQKVVQLNSNALE